jgi:hypothetical protein
MYILLDLTDSVSLLAHFLSNFLPFCNKLLDLDMCGLGKQAIVHADTFLTMANTP